MEALVRVNVELKVFTYEVDSRVIARCPYLNAVSSGDTAETALAHLGEELRFLIETCTEEGNLLPVLQHRLAIADQEWPQEPAAKALVDLREHWIVLALPAEGIEQLTHAALHQPESARIR